MANPTWGGFCCRRRVCLHWERWQRPDGPVVESPSLCSRLHDTIADIEAGIANTTARVSNALRGLPRPNCSRVSGCLDRCGARFTTGNVCDETVLQNMAQPLLSASPSSVRSETRSAQDTSSDSAVQSSEPVAQQTMTPAESVSTEEASLGSASTDSTAETGAAEQRTTAPSTSPFVPVIATAAASELAVAPQSDTESSGSDYDNQRRYPVSSLLELRGYTTDLMTRKLKKSDSVFMADFSSESSMSQEELEAEKKAVIAVYDKNAELVAQDTVKKVTTSQTKMKSSTCKVKEKNDENVHASDSAGPAPFAPVNGEQVLFTFTEGARRVGPGFAPPIVWDGKAVGTVLTAVETRTKRKYTLNKTSQLYANYINAGKAMATHWFSHDNIKQALHDFDIKNAKPKKWSDNKFDVSYQSLTEHPKLAFAVDWHIKSEVGFKQGKSARIIQNEGPEKCIRNLQVIHVLEEVIFKNIGKDMCIKDEDKRVVLDRLCERFSQKRRPIRYNKDVKGPVVSDKLIDNFAVFGIDQSAFDFSCTVDGLLRVEIDLIIKIADFIQCDSKKEWMKELIEDRERFIATGVLRVDGNLRILVEGLRTRASGDRGTSVLNWIVEFLATITCVFDRPCDIVRDMATSSLNIVNPWYKTHFVDEDGHAIYSFFDGCFEGDDGLIQVVKKLLTKRDKIEENYHTLGLDCTLETSSNDSATVVEFVGCHILFDKLGKTYYGKDCGGAFVPCINKALVKSSYTLSTQKLADVATSSYHSRYLQFAGKQDWIAGYFKAMRDAHGGKIIEALFHDAYAGREQNASPLPKKVQDRLLRLSTGLPDERNFDVFNTSVGVNTSSSDIIADFPRGFMSYVKKLMDLAPSI